MVKVYEYVVGRNLECYQQFTDRLSNRTRIRQESLDACEFILAFVAITSRVGTDIEAAFKVIPEGKPVILVVFHHTFDGDYVIPDCGRFINREGVSVYNMLFHETENGLLRCLQNDEQLKRLSDWLIGETDESVPIHPAHNGNNNRNYRKLIIRGVVIGIFIAIVVGTIFAVRAALPHRPTNYSLIESGQ